MTFIWEYLHRQGWGQFNSRIAWNCSSIPIPELELELKLVELKMELELKTLELELKTGIEFFATATAAITTSPTISKFLF